MLRSLARIPLIVPRETPAYALTHARKFTTKAETTSSVSEDQSEPDLLHTPLYDYHVQSGGKMVDFAGWSLPVQYPTGVMNECKSTREIAGIFDVSHMQQLRFYGDNAGDFIESLSVANIRALKPGQGQYSLLTNENGGIIDDMVVVKRPDHIYVVCNAACADKDIAHFRDALASSSDWSNVKLDVVNDSGLIALQGPKAASIIQSLSDTDYDISKLGFFCSDLISLRGINCLVSRSGYTGEDGFEISVPAESTLELTQALMETEGVVLAGLGARDALRLEAGLCLYGHDLDDTSTPIEAGLQWTIGKRRRSAADFPGADVILNQLNEGPDRVRVGLIGHKAPARENANIEDMDGNSVGCVTSGGFSPTLQKPIAIGYISSDLASPGTQLNVIVRDKPQLTTVSKMPFITTNYYRPAKKQ